MGWEGWEGLGERGMAAVLVCTHARQWTRNRLFAHINYAHAEMLAVIYILRAFRVCVCVFVQTSHHTHTHTHGSYLPTREHGTLITIGFFLFHSAAPRKCALYTICNSHARPVCCLASQPVCSNSCCDRVRASERQLGHVLRVLAQSSLISAVRTSTSI